MGHLSFLGYVYLFLHHCQDGIFINNFFKFASMGSIITNISPCISFMDIYTKYTFSQSNFYYYSITTVKYNSITFIGEGLNLNFKPAIKFTAKSLGTKSRDIDIKIAIQGCQYIGPYLVLIDQTFYFFSNFLIRFSISSSFAFEWEIVPYVFLVS